MITPATIGAITHASPRRPRYGPRVPTFVVGSALALLGIAVRVWGCGHLQKNRLVVTSGPYAHVQHPLYLGTFLIALGAVLAAGYQQTTLTAVLGFVAVVFATINVVGGFMVTDRMLRMFKKRD